MLSARKSRISLVPLDLPLDHEISTAIRSPCRHLSIRSPDSVSPSLYIYSINTRALSTIITDFTPNQKGYPGKRIVALGKPAPPELVKWLRVEGHVNKCAGTVRLYPLYETAPILLQKARDPECKAALDMLLAPPYGVSTAGAEAAAARELEGQLFLIPRKSTLEQYVPHEGEVLLALTRMRTEGEHIFKTTAALSNAFEVRVLSLDLVFFSVSPTCMYKHLFFAY